MMTGVKVIEQSIIPKTGKASDCEDGLVVTGDFAAVVDGATDKNGRRFDGLTGGRLAMETVIVAIESLPARCDAGECVDALTRALADRLPSDLPPMELPGAAVTVYSAFRREIWQVGDVGAWWPGRSPEQARKLVDRINTDMRVAITRAELLKGTDQDQILAGDPGRASIMPLLTRQAMFANNTEAGPLAYGVINGLPVPGNLINTIPVPDEVDEVVIASDGYPKILPDLASAEAALHALLLEDPLCIGVLAGTKALPPGGENFDDRTYLRLDLTTS